MKDCDLWKMSCWGLAVTCAVLIAMLYYQQQHINYLEGLTHKYFMK